MTSSPRRRPGVTAPLLAILLLHPGGGQSWAVLLLGFLLTGAVLLPAIWSRRASRRRAALALLDRLLPRRGPEREQ